MVHSFAAHPLPNLAEVGGKGLSLLRMSLAGLPVPAGFVLGVDFFDPWIEQLRSLPEWSAMRAAMAGETGLEGAALRMQTACRALSLTAGQERQLDQGLGRLEPDGVLAVRSSSPQEDLVGASFAGGYESTLGVTAASLADAVRDTFASAFDPRVFGYKRHHGIPLDEPRIAVVVQQQVAAEIAGVAFSLNPVTNDYDEVVVDANWGLGESVVAGRVSPDHFVVDKVDHRILTRQVGEKETSVWLSPDGGTVERPDPRRGGPCLTDAQLRELVDLVQGVEKLFERPVDIEWAYVDGQFHLLQARPITAYVPLSATMRTHPGKRRILYLDAALSEGVATNRPMAPLTLHWLFDLLGLFGSDLLGPVSTPADADPERSLIFAAGGRYYLNLSVLFTVVSGRQLARSYAEVDGLLSGLLKAVDQELYEATEKPDYLRWGPLLRRLPVALWRSRKLIAQTVSALRRPEPFQRLHEQVVDQTVGALAAEIDPQTPLGELTDRHGRLVADAWTRVSLPALIVYLVNLGRLNKLFAHGTEEQKRLVDVIQTGLPGNEAVELGVRLYAMAQLLPPDDFADLDHLSRQVERRELPTEFLAAWDEFVRRYGCRGPGELELTNPRYGDDPRLALEQMSYMIGSDLDPAAVQRRHFAERELAYDRLLGPLRGPKRRRFEQAYRSLVQLGGTRDTPKYLMVAVNGAFRRQALAVAEGLVTAGRLDAPEHVFDLTVPEIDAARHDPGLDLRRIRADRRSLLDEVDRVRTFPHLIDSRGRIGQVPDVESEPGVYIGLGVSRGRATGRVKVLQNPRDKPVERGDVLVAYTTDPGWTPLFVNAAAIILEVGGMLQHGGVVAREYGKPCVAGIQGITTALEDGQQVEVDGTTGIVRLLGSAPDGSGPSGPAAS